MSPRRPPAPRPRPPGRLGGAARRASANACHRCAVMVLRGADASVMALEAAVELSPLTATGEALAQLAGRFTYRLHWLGPELSRRDSWRIAGAPAGSRDGPAWVDVRAEHVCGADPLPVARHVLAAWVAHLNARSTRGWDVADEPPF